MASPWDGVKKALAVGAPLLANAIVPGSGGLAAGLVARVLGVDNDPGVIEARLQTASPEEWVKLKTEENRHEERLVELATANDQVYLADRQNARTREIELTRATGKRDINLYILAWTVVLGFFVLCGGLMRWTVPDGSSQVVFLLFGSLATGFATVLQYFFGSSKSSSDKTVLLAGKK